MKTSAAAMVSASAFSLGLPNRAYAAGFERVRVGVIGCGGRGSGAVMNCLEADDGVEIVAIADAFQDRLDGSLEKIKQWCGQNGKPFAGRVKVTPDTTFL